MISVIVPIYKVEKYLDECIKSVLSQTFTNFELILVDDGSPDICPKICDEYALQDKRVRVFHKQNGGLSEARNFGAYHAKGNYVTFIDADDYVGKEYLKVLSQLQSQYQADICVCGIKKFIDRRKPKTNKRVNTYCYTGLDALEKMLYQKMLDTSACAMLLPKKFILKYPFPVGKYHEDEFTTYKYYIDSTKVAVSTKKLYYYRQRQGSIMHTFGQACIDELEAADNLVCMCKQYYPELINAAMSKKFSDYCQVLLSSKNLHKDAEDIYDKISNYLTNTRKQILFDKNTRIKNRVAALALLLGPKGLILLNKIVK